VTRGGHRWANPFKPLVIAPPCDSPVDDGACGFTRLAAAITFADANTGAMVAVCRGISQSAQSAAASVKAEPFSGRAVSGPERAAQRRSDPIYPRPCSPARRTSGPSPPNPRAPSPSPLSSMPAGRARRRTGSPSLSIQRTRHHRPILRPADGRLEVPARTPQIQSSASRSATPPPPSPSRAGPTATASMCVASAGLQRPAERYAGGHLTHLTGRMAKVQQLQQKRGSQLDAACPSPGSNL
jgi:hypothetical protein